MKTIKRKRKMKKPSELPVYVSHLESNLENHLAGYNKSGFTAYPKPEEDALLNSYLCGYNVGITG
jgi:hypothetical protein